MKHTRIGVVLLGLVFTLSIMAAANTPAHKVVRVPKARASLTQEQKPTSADTTVTSTKKVSHRKHRSARTGGTTAKTEEQSSTTKTMKHTSGRHAKKHSKEMKDTTGTTEQKPGGGR